MRRVASILAAVPIVIGVTTAAFAEPITITSDMRAAVVNTLMNRSVDFRSPAPRGDSLAATAVADGQGVATATLDSSFANPMRQFGAGTVAVSSTAKGKLEALSAYAVTFSVTSPVNYTFDLSFSERSAYGDDGDGFAHYLQTDANLYFNTGRLDKDGDIDYDSMFSYFTPPMDGTATNADNVSFDGRLMPGDYLFWVLTKRVGTSQDAGSASADFQFTFNAAPADTAPVPEPASMLLLGGSLVGLAGYRGRFLQKLRGRFGTASRN